MRVGEVLIWLNAALETFALYEYYWNGDSTTAFFLLSLAVCNYLYILAMFTVRVGYR